MKQVICAWGWLLVITLCCPDIHAAWSLSSDFFTMDLSGSFRSVNAGTRNYEAPVLFGENNTYDGFSQSILRVTMDGIVEETVRYEIHVVSEIYAATSPSFLLPGSTQSRSGTTRYRITKTAWYLAEDSDFSVTMNADRMNVQVSFPSVDMTLGRQAINFSQAYFWNPLDVFLPFAPESFDRDYKPGVDALRADIFLGSFSSLSLVGSTGRRLSVQISDGGSHVTAQDFGEDLWYA
ncbi:MAG: hypothetical protein RRA35_07680, partial [Desulfomonilia bacterium]|nr:hypothetical protein [Desulfomonilia bacterium]